MLVWDIIQNIEHDSYDVANDSQMLFDQNGSMYILDSDYLVMGASGGRSFCYQLEGHDYFQQLDDDALISKGYKMDD